jgi:hypothetical protein
MIIDNYYYLTNGIKIALYNDDLLVGKELGEICKESETFLWMGNVGSGVNNRRREIDICSQPILTKGVRRIQK